MKNNKFIGLKHCSAVECAKKSLKVDACVRSLNTLIMDNDATHSDIPL